MMTHELGRKLLIGPNVPVYHFDPSRVDLRREMNEGVDPSLTEPLLELDPGDEGSAGPRVLIQGTCSLADDDAEETVLQQTRVTYDLVEWLDRQTRTRKLTLKIFSNADGDTCMMVADRIFIGQNLPEAIAEWADEESKERAGG